MAAKTGRNVHSLLGLSQSRFNCCSAGLYYINMVERSVLNDKQRLGRQIGTILLECRGEEERMARRYLGMVTRRVVIAHVLQIGDTSLGKIDRALQTVYEDCQMVGPNCGKVADLANEFYSLETFRPLTSTRPSSITAL